jgi:hypothetical protein
MQTKDILKTMILRLEPNMAGVQPSYIILNFLHIQILGNYHKDC